MSQRVQKVLRSAIIVGVVGALVGFAVYSAFSSSTTNPSNRFETGTVTLADNDSGAALYDATNQKPGVALERCIKLTYTGSLDSSVRLYTSDTIGNVGAYTNLKIEAGTQASSAFPSCTGFTADAGGPLYDGTLAGFASAHNSYANGLSDFPGTSATKWVANDAVVYRITVSAQDDNNAAGKVSGLHALRWESRNQ